MIVIILNAMCVLSYVVDGVDRYIRKINRETYKHLEKVCKDTSYSLVKAKDVEGLVNRKCGLLSCMIRRRSIFGDEYINLLEVREEYTGYKDGSAEIWRKMGEIAREDPLLLVLLSGIRYSISTHLCSFHRRFLGTYASNPSLFLRKYDDSHRTNFYLTYIIVRECVGNIDVKNMRGTNVELERVVSHIRSHSDFGQAVHHGMKSDESIRRVERIIELLSLVDCERCQLWGRIQLEGLKTSLKILGDVSDITDDERFFIVNLFMRLSVSVEENIRLREYRVPYLMVFPLYWMEISSLLISCLVISIAGSRSRKMRTRTSSGTN